MVHLVESVEPENDISLEGWTSCNVSVSVGFHFGVANTLLCVQAFANATKQLYASSFFKEKGQGSSGFLQALTPYLDGRSAVFENMVRPSYYTHGREPWLTPATVEREPYSPATLVLYVSRDGLIPDL